VPHRIRLSSAAAKTLESYPKSVKDRIADRINELGVDPRPADAKVLKGRSGLLRVRVGNYRIVYQFDAASGVVGIVRIGHRSDIYRRLP
jgi:mRNA interferase RelE/StbE